MLVEWKIYFHVKNIRAYDDFRRLDEEENVYILKKYKPLPVISKTKYIFFPLECIFEITCLPCISVYAYILGYPVFYVYSKICILLIR